MQVTDYKLPKADYFDYTILDGYDWIQQQTGSIHGKLYVMAEYGDWPYVAAVRGARDDKYIIKEYCEHDVKTWVFTDKNEYTQALNYFRGIRL